MNNRTKSPNMLKMVEYHCNLTGHPLFVFETTNCKTPKDHRYYIIYHPHCIDKQRRQNVCTYSNIVVISIS